MSESTQSTVRGVRADIAPVQGGLIVSKRARNGHRFVLEVGSQNPFPAFQVDPVFQVDGGEVRQDVMDIIRIMYPDGDPWTIAAWLDRTHQVAMNPWFFDAVPGRGRFNLRAPRGTCYLASSRGAAAREQT